MMKRVLCSQLPQPGHSVLLSETEATHLTRVLRLKEGDLVQAMDGNGNTKVLSLKFKGGSPRLENDEKAQNANQQSNLSLSPADPLPIILEMAILKGDAMEWVIEKAVELGVSTLIPTLTAHTVVQIKNKGPESFQHRWQKIADQALKQCGRLKRMEVAFPISLETLLQKTEGSPSTLRIWCDEGEKDSAPFLMDCIQSQNFGQLNPIRLLVGPEGGWSEIERSLLDRNSASTIKVSLGPLILRAETAALFGLSLVAGKLRSSK